MALKYKSFFILSFIINHRLQNPNGNIVFTCRIIHSVKTMTSVVHVFFHDKLAAVAHVIGTDQLPIETQVMKCLNDLRSSAMSNNSKFSDFFICTMYKYAFSIENLDTYVNITISNSMKCLSKWVHGFLL